MSLESPSVANLPPVLRRLRLMREETGSASHRVIDQILSNPHGFLGWTIADLAVFAGTSEATVVRLVQGLGFRSYQEFKLQLSRTLATLETSASLVAEPNDPPETVLSKTFAASEVSLRDTLEHLDSSTFKAVVELLAQARRIEFIGSGSSGLIALDAYQKLLKLGLMCGASTDPHNFSQVCALLEPADVVVAISFSGQNPDTLHGARLAKEAGAAVVALTGLGRNPLSKLADHTLPASSPDSPYRPEAIAARIAQLCLIDALVASLHILAEPFSSRRVEKAKKALSRPQKTRSP